MSNMHASFKPYKPFRFIFTFTLYINCALILSHLLDILGTSVYTECLYYLLGQSYKHLVWFSFTFIFINRHLLLGVQAFIFFSLYMTTLSQVCLFLMSECSLYNYEGSLLFISPNRAHHQACTSVHLSRGRTLILVWTYSFQHLSIF